MYTAIVNHKGETLTLNYHNLKQGRILLNEALQDEYTTLLSFTNAKGIHLPR
jgi:hypothetical protein